GPLPRDRVFFLYNYAGDVTLGRSPVTTHRFVVGFEKTIFQQAASLELRLPLASALNSNLLLEGDTDGADAEVGNALLALKLLLYHGAALDVATGLRFTFPTGSDTTLTSTTLQQRLRVQNDTLALQPFLTAAWAPLERAFVQGFV